MALITLQESSELTIHRTFTAYTQLLLTTGTGINVMRECLKYDVTNNTYTHKQSNPELFEKFPSYY